MCKAIVIQWPYWYKDFTGLTIWPFVFVKDKNNKKLVKHEMVHVEQQLKGWLIGFYIKYLYYLWKYGYYNNPYEIEARERSK